MLLQVEGHQRSEYKDHFYKMFEHRKILFHDQKQWDVKVIDGRFEIDEYDREDTVYLMSFDRRGQLVGSVRLLSTTTPHMMAGPFKPMFPDVDFTSPLIWEATRFAVHGDVELQPNLVSRAACELMLGVVQFGLKNGVEHITGVYDAAMSRLYRRCGFINIELARCHTPLHGTVYAGLCAVSRELEASILNATALDVEPADLRAA